jgi:glutamate-1-semialdehyde 2,1-aminomutase
VLFTDEVVRNYRDWLELIDYEFHENYWFAMLNQGVMPHPHDASQQWTISVQHEERHIDEHIEAFKQIAPRLADEQPDYLDAAVEPTVSTEPVTTD